MTKRISYFIAAMALLVVGFSILGFEEVQFSLRHIFGISLVLTAGGFIGTAFDAEYSSFSNLEEEKFFEIRSCTEQNEYYYYQIIQNGKVEHIRDVREFQLGTYIRSGKEITLRTGH